MNLCGGQTLIFLLKTGTFARYRGRRRPLDRPEQPTHSHPTARNTTGRSAYQHSTETFRQTEVTYSTRSQPLLCIQRVFLSLRVSLLPTVASFFLSLYLCHSIFLLSLVSVAPICMVGASKWWCPRPCAVALGRRSVLSVPTKCRTALVRGKVGGLTAK